MTEVIIIRKEKKDVLFQSELCFVPVPSACIAERFKYKAKKITISTVELKKPKD